jgi:hypothetical protein
MKDDARNHEREDYINMCVCMFVCMNVYEPVV